MTVIPSLRAEAELEDYEALLASPGWARLVKWAETEWANKVATHSEAAADRSDGEALSLLRQIIAGKRAAQLLLAHPQDRVVLLKSQRPAADAYNYMNADPAPRTHNFYR
jgi:hypothetical protein